MFINIQMVSNDHVLTQRDWYSEWRIFSLSPFHRQDPMGGLLFFWVDPIFSFHLLYLYGILSAASSTASS